MDNIVYILGAGFSAPLEIPIMSNFLDKARSIYAEDKQRYKHFGVVFDSIRKRLAYVSQYYHTDLDNIEEVLSILEMERSLGNASFSEVNEYKVFISDVIQHFTPSFGKTNQLKRTSAGKYCVSDREPRFLVEFEKMLFNYNGKDISYGRFVLELFNAKIQTVGITSNESQLKPAAREVEFKCEIEESPKEHFSVITLNYDLVLENLAGLYSSVTNENKLVFANTTSDSGQKTPELAKLHGSIERNNIIPPTWNKYLSEQIYNEWKLAYKLLSSANYIRILGYSLPDGDAYVRYLLKSSVLESEYLKGIDVICKDNDGSVKKRYVSFISLKSPKYRFLNEDLYEYIRHPVHNVKRHEQFIQERSERIV